MDFFDGLDAQQKKQVARVPSVASEVREQAHERTSSIDQLDHSRSTLKTNFVKFDKVHEFKSYASNVTT